MLFVHTRNRRMVPQIPARRWTGNRADDVIDLQLVEQRYREHHDRTTDAHRLRDGREGSGRERLGRDRGTRRPGRRSAPW